MHTTVSGWSDRKRHDYSGGRQVQGHANYYQLIPVQHGCFRPAYFPLHASGPVPHVEVQALAPRGCALQTLSVCVGVVHVLNHTEHHCAVRGALPGHMFPVTRKGFGHQKACARSDLFPLDSVSFERWPRVRHGGSGEGHHGASQLQLMDQRDWLVFGRWGHAGVQDDALRRGVWTDGGHGVAQLSFLLHASVLSNSALQPHRPSAVAEAQGNERKLPSGPQGQKQQTNHQDAR